MGAFSCPLLQPKSQQNGKKPMDKLEPFLDYQNNPTTATHNDSGAWCGDSQNVTQEAPQELSLEAQNASVHQTLLSSCPHIQISKAAVTPQQMHGRQQPRFRNGARGTASWHSPSGCCVTGGSLHKSLVATSCRERAATRGCSLSALTRRKVARSRSSMVTPPRGVGVFWRHCGQGIQRCSLATASRRLRQVWQKVWPQ